MLKTMRDLSGNGSSEVNGAKRSRLSRSLSACGIGATNIVRKNNVSRAAEASVSFGRAYFRLTTEVLRAGMNYRAFAVLNSLWSRNAIVDKTKRRNVTGESDDRTMRMLRAVVITFITIQ